MIKKVKSLAIIAFALVCGACPFGPDGPLSYTVYFDANGGTGIAPSPIRGAAGSTIILPNQNGLTNGGAQFGGWNEQSEDREGQYSAGSTFTIRNTDITLYAFWNTSFQTYTVSFDANGGIGTAPAPQPVQAGSPIVLPSGDSLTRAGFVFKGWVTGDPESEVYPSDTSYTPTGNITLLAKWDPDSLAARLALLQTTVVSGGKYTIEVNEDESIGPQTLSYSGRDDITITLKGSVGKQSIGLSGNGSMFTVSSGVTLILDNNITLEGHEENNASLIRVDSGGTLFMYAGAAITNNKENFSTGGGSGVYVGQGGSFTMTGGSISGNTTASNSGGGGVYVDPGGIFTMTGGTISENTTTSNLGGGGIYVGGTFDMFGGIISQNSASNGYGGGVCVDKDGVFNMHHGTISENTVFAGGGGVYVNVDGIFNMKNGTISANTAQGSGGGVFTAGNFTMDNGIITGNHAGKQGGGVNVFGTTGTFKLNRGTVSGNTSVEEGNDVFPLDWE